MQHKFHRCQKYSFQEFNGFLGVCHVCSYEHTLHTFAYQGGMERKKKDQIYAVCVSRGSVSSRGTRMFRNGQKFITLSSRAYKHP